MKNNLSEIVFLLDRSGSMSGLEKATIDGFNELIAKQKLEDSPSLVSTVLFDHEQIVLHDRQDIRKIGMLSERDYQPRGSTSLLDAIGHSISHIKRLHRLLPDELVPARTLFVITTDGMENTSREYTYRSIQRMIAQQQQQGWEFLFLGANIDAPRMARSIGIHASRAANYHADAQGTRSNFRALNKAVSSVRRGRRVDENWSAEIDQDFKSRKKRR